MRNIVRVDMTEEQEEQLKGCPFCGVESLDAFMDMGHRQWLQTRNYWIQCRDCQAQGPYAGALGVAIFGWNNHRGPGGRIDGGPFNIPAPPE
jgi:hypothetical protein